MKPHIVIVGAGISGLALGWFLFQKYGDSIDLSILEKEKRTGGWIKSIDLQGFLFDTGPRSCRTRGSGKHTLKLVEALGLNDEIVGSSPNARHRYLYTDGCLQRLPSGLVGACFSPLTRRFLPTLLKEWSKPPQVLQEESIASFISRRFSPEFASNLFDPLTLGIYAGDIHNLSMASCFPEMAQWEHQYGSIVKAMFKGKSPEDPSESPFVKKMSTHPIVAFKSGMETITHGLASKLESKIQLGMAVTKITASSSGVVVSTDAEDILCDHVFLAIPPRAITSAIAPLSSALNSFHAASVASVHLGWNTKVLPKEGFGYLIPSKEKEFILGVIFDSSAFPQQNAHDNQTRITAMVGGPTGLDIFAETDESLKSIAISAIQTQLKIETPPDVIAVSRAPHAIPQYTLGHNNRVTILKSSVDKLFNGKATLLGSSWHGVSVNDCIREAETITGALLLTK